MQALEAMQASTSFEIPERMKYKFREIKNIFKHQIRFFASTGQQEVQAGQTIMCELPNNTVVDLASFTMQYVGKTTHNGKAGVGASDYIQSRFMPRNSASIIQELTVDINGQSRFSLNDYNLVWNILFDNTAAQDSLSRRSAGSENADPSRKHFKLGNSIMERRGYPIAKNPEAVGTTEDEKKVAYDEQLYIIRSWLGLCSSQATTTIIDTTLLGSVVIKIRLASPTILMLGECSTSSPTQRYKRKQML
jgi:hypothetical protein